MDLVIRSGCLVRKLIAWKVKDLKALVVALVIQILKRIVLGRKAASCRRIDYQKNLASRNVPANSSAAKRFGTVVPQWPGPATISSLWISPLGTPT